MLLFRRLELLLGSSVKASALVFAVYMGGLALGGLGGLLAWSQRRPRIKYAGLELVIGALGLALVLGLPALAPWYARSDVAPLVVLGLMLLPVAGMGLALPLLANVALASDPAYRRDFGQLYAANTAGAVLGALGAVLVLRQWGISAAAGAAALANALAALLVAWPAARETPLVLARWNWRLGRREAVILLAAGLGGALLLALEVVWLRVLWLKLRATDWQFAWLLAVVIAGLSLGGLLSRALPAWGWALLAGLGVAAGYAAYDGIEAGGTLAVGGLPALLVAIVACIGSGGLFTRLAVRLRASQPSSAMATGGLYAVNAAGAAAGATAAVFVLLPLLGPDLAWRGLAGGYALLALMLAPAWRGLAAAALVLLAAALTPDAVDRALERAVAQFPGYEVVARRHAVDATHQLAERRWHGQAIAHRLVTDGFSMSGTEVDSLRYMRAFATLPQALGSVREALLISHGLGNTADTLLADPALEQLTVVDTSVATLELAAQLPRPDPLADPRSRTVIDDGRQFLLTDAGRYDLITAEPPPPRLAGVVNLYTAEYFELARRHLNDGGLITHWLPVDQLTQASSAAILRAFCAAFPDCSLWAGSHYNWLLLGSRGGLAPVETGAFSRLWREPGAAGRLAEVGYERPALLLTGFIADAAQIGDWIGPGPRLDDDHPGRLETRALHPGELEQYFAFMDDRETERRFAGSAWLQARLPAALRRAARDDWLWQPVLNGQVRLQGPALVELGLASLEQGLRQPLLRLLQLSERELAAARAVTVPEPEAAFRRGVAALLDGRPVMALHELKGADGPAAPALRVIARCRLSGECQPPPPTP